MSRHTLFVEILEQLRPVEPRPLFRARHSQPVHKLFVGRFPAMRRRNQVRSYVIHSRACAGSQRLTLRFGQTKEEFFEHFARLLPIR